MIKRTEDGINWYEDEFPPKGNMISKYYGYDSWNECMLFHEFVVNMYDIVITHKGKTFKFDISPDGVVWTNPNSENLKTEWDSPVEFVKNFEIERNKLVDIVNELEYIDGF